VPPFAVLQVCMGNICRSPMAERLLMAAAYDLVGDKASDLLLVRGAGTGGWHVGNPMDPGAARQIRLRGGDPDGFVARKLAADDIDSADLILTATAEQQTHVAALRPDAVERTFVLGECARLLERVDRRALPPFAADPAAGPDAVYARGVALVAAMHAARGAEPARPDDDLDDPWGGDDRSFSRVADRIEQLTRPLAATLLVS
jgi:low molecular weight protein-tyrosine phosphatase